MNKTLTTKPNNPKSFLKVSRFSRNVQPKCGHAMDVVGEVLGRVGLGSINTLIGIPNSCWSECDEILHKIPVHSLMYRLKKEGTEICSGRGALGDGYFGTNIDRIKGLAKGFKASLPEGLFVRFLGLNWGAAHRL